MSVPGHVEAKIATRLPRTVATEVVTLLNASGGGQAQSTASLQLEREMGVILGHEVRDEFISLMNAVGKGTTKVASVLLMSRVNAAFGHEAALELSPILTNIH